MGRQNIAVTVDAVVFGYERPASISVLLIQRKNPPFQGGWALPGGFVEDKESLETAVERELWEETGVRINYLEQLYTFGKPGRDPRQRIVSVAYFGLVKPKAYHIVAATDAKAVQWFPMDDLPPLAFDHDEIIAMAINRLRAKVTYEPIGFELLEEKFPFSDLENLYTTLLGRPIDRRNFRKKIMSLKVVEELKEKRSLGPGRPASLFRFNKEKYFQLKKEGIVFEV